MRFKYTIIVQVRYIIIETKEFAPRPSPEYSCWKRNQLYPIRSASFVSIVLYPILVTTKLITGIVSRFTCRSMKVMDIFNCWHLYIEPLNDNIDLCRNKNYNKVSKSRLDIFNSKVGKFSIRYKKILNSRWKNFHLKVRIFLIQSLYIKHT